MSKKIGKHKVFDSLHCFISKVFDQNLLTFTSYIKMEIISILKLEFHPLCWRNHQ